MTCPQPSRCLVGSLKSWMQETTFGSHVFPSAIDSLSLFRFFKVCLWSLKEVSISIASCWFELLVTDWYPWKANSSQTWHAVSMYVNVGVISRSAQLILANYISMKLWVEDGSVEQTDGIWPTTTAMYYLPSCHEMYVLKTWTCLRWFFADCTNS